MSTATPKHRCHTMVQPAFPCEEFNDAPSAGRRREANLLQDTETAGRTACGRPPGLETASTAQSVIISGSGAHRHRPIRPALVRWLQCPCSSTG